jgi:amidase
VEAAVAHKKTYTGCKDEYGPVLASVIKAGRALSGCDYQKILLRRMDFRGRVAALFQTIDVLLIPVHPFPPPTLAMLQTLGEQPVLISKLQRFTCPFDLTGNPTVTLPGGFTHRGLAVGFRLAAGLQEECWLAPAPRFRK